MCPEREAGRCPRHIIIRSERHLSIGAHRLRRRKVLSSIKIALFENYIELSGVLDCALIPAMLITNLIWGARGHRIQSLWIVRKERRGLSSDDHTSFTFDISFSWWSRTVAMSIITILCVGDRLYEVLASAGVGWEKQEHRYSHWGIHACIYTSSNFQVFASRCSIYLNYWTLSS